MNDFVLQLMEAARTHNEWLDIVKFGRQSLLERQGLFVEVVFREAERLANNDKSQTARVADLAAGILTELDLRLERSPNRLPERQGRWG